MEWIDVKDRLPEVDDCFFCYNKYNEFLFADFIKDDGVVWWDTDEHSYVPNQTELITHWMPLPIPIKK